MDFICTGSYRKLNPGPVRCELGEWKPNVPFCIHPSMSQGDKGFKKTLQPVIKQSCGKPQKLKSAYTYVNGLPLEWDKQFNFPDGTDVLYRCSTLKAKTKSK